MTDQQPQPPQPEAPERIWVSPLIQLTGRLNYEYYIGSTNWSGDCVQYIRADLAAERPAKKVRPLSACCAAEVIDTTVCSKCRTFHADYAVAERPADEDERVKAAREDERRATFREAIAVIAGLPVEHYIFSGRHPMHASIFRDNAVKTLEAAIVVRSRSERVGECRDATKGDDA